MMTIEVAPEKANNPALMFQDSIQEQQRYQDLIRTLLSFIGYNPYREEKCEIESRTVIKLLMSYEPEWTKARIKELIEANTKEAQE